MSNLSQKNYCRRRESSESVEAFTSTNFHSQNVIASFHIPSGEICAKLTSCLSLHHFSILKIFRSYRRGKIRGKTERERECEWVKNKLSKFVDRRLVFVFNSFDKPWKIVWLTSNGFFSTVKLLKKNLDRSFDEEIEQCPATTMKWRPNISSRQKIKNPGKSTNNDQPNVS